MADVLQNVQFLQDNTHTTGHIVPNPTYGVSWRESTEMLSDIAESMVDDYQSVSAVNPQYSTVDLSKKTKYRPASPPQNFIEEGGIPIPGRSQDSSSNNYTDGYSAPRNNGFFNNSPTNIQNGGSSYSSSFPSCGSPVPLLPQNTVPPPQSLGLGAMGSQASQRSDSSSNSDSGRPLQQQVTFSADYSYARHPSISSTNSRVRNVSESQSVCLSTQTSRIEEETEQNFQTTAFIGKKQQSPEITENISYGQYHNKQYKDKLKIHDTSTTIDMIIGIFAIVSLIISLSVIILVIALLVRLNNSQETVLGTTTNVDQSVLDSNGTTLGQCNCPAINQVNQLKIKVNELRDRLQKLKQNVSLPVLTNRLSGIVSDVSSLNQSVLDLRREANETVRTDSLQAPANVSFNSSHHHDCVVEHNEQTCPFYDLTNYFCRSVGVDFIVNNMIIVDFNCYTTSVDNSVITASQVAIQVPDFSASLASQINNAQLSCMCTSFGKADGTCNVFITRCPYISSKIPASFST